MSKLIGIGECLIDFLPAKNNQYIMKSGGAPVNVCACVAMLGEKSYFLGKLSKDFFGEFLLKNIKNSGINTEYISYSNESTSLAFVSLDEKGDRHFSFYRDNNADLLLDENEVKSEYFEKGDVLHMCSVGLVESPSKYAHIKAIKLAKQNNSFICFDVNIRLSLYPSEKKCKDTVLEFLPYANIIKLTDEELEFLIGKIDEKNAIQKLFEISKDAKFVFLTKGENGATVYDRNLNSIKKPALKVKVVDTTGAGDCFIGCVIYKLLTIKNELQLKDMAEVLNFAIAGSSIVVTKKGAMNAMPNLKQVNKVLKEIHNENN
ncbi:carbohydrate kinase [Methanoculleus sp.]|uniref:carbohydrate kinase family protein n=1 Tax=Methanoculleus sp. TaxID=90427 RepID=UPI0025E68A3A|nr:carbohydrate kinase [Methanoculleus sp.]MCK9319996.1 carbohydrate kinase [Methanoculleus sp.]